MIKQTKVLTLSLLAVLLFAVVLPFSVIFADEISTTGLDGTSIYEDLKDAKILGETFDFDKYKPNEHGSTELLAFVEFGFSLMHEYQKCYGLYLYIYFPQGNLIDSEQNQVKFAMRYNGSDVVEYGDLQLKLISKDAFDVLYKFKVVDSEKHKVLELYERVAKNSEERIYEINGVELFQNGKENAVDYGVGGTWTLTGYGKGMHKSSMEESTLQSVATFKNTLKLDVHSTYYRTWKNILNTVGDQLSSVYFSVDNSIDKEYDRLYAIDFDTYKYLSSPIFCIYNAWYPGISTIMVDYNAVYNNLYNQRTKATSEFENLPNADFTWLRWCNMDDACFAFYGNSSPYPSNDMYVYLDKLAWVFQTSNEKDHKFTSEELLTYMREFTEEFGCSDGEKYNSLLFSSKFYAPLHAGLSDKVFTGANIGRTITYDDSWPINGSLTQYDFGDVLKLLFEHTQDTADINLKPIQEVTWSEIKNLTDEQISQTYFIAESDVPEFKHYVKNENSLNKTVYLFRYDMESFHTEQLYAENLGICGYVWQEPIYLDFDIISLTYEKAGVKTIIPVVSNPIDIIAGIEPPSNSLIPEFENLWKSTMTDFLTTLFGIIAIALFVFLVLRFLKFVFKKK